MTYRVDWDQTALDEAAGYLDDTVGLAAVMDVTDQLSAVPRPDGALSMGGGRHRVHVSRYRVYYDVDDHAKTVTVIRCGRVAT